MRKRTRIASVKVIGNKIRFKRNFLGLTLKDVGEMTGLSYGTISRAERIGRIGAPAAKKVSIALGIPMEELMGINLTTNRRSNLEDRRAVS